MENDKRLEIYKKNMKLGIKLEKAILAYTPPIEGHVLKQVAQAIKIRSWFYKNTTLRDELTFMILAEAAIVAYDMARKKEVIND